MSVASQGTPPAAGEEGASRHQGGVKPLLDLSGVDLTRRLAGRDEIAKLNPHRGVMALVDWVVWTSKDYRQGVALKQVRNDEFWVAGHFPARPMFPGVLMIEAGAQMACYLYNIRQPEPKLVAFLRIEDASFRNMVEP